MAPEPNPMVRSLGANALAIGGWIVGEFAAISFFHGSGEPHERVMVSAAVAIVGVLTSLWLKASFASILIGGQAIYILVEQGISVVFGAVPIQGGTSHFANMAVATLAAFIAWKTLGLTVGDRQAGPVKRLLASQKTLAVVGCAIALWLVAECVTLPMLEASSWGNSQRHAALALCSFMGAAAGSLMVRRLKLT